MSYRAGFALLLAAAGLWAREEASFCATTGYDAEEEQALHDAYLQSPQYKQMIARRAAQGVRVNAIRDVGDVVLMDESDGVVARRNPFNQANRVIRFQPVAGVAERFIYDSTTDVAYEPNLAERGAALALADDDSAEVTLPFAFPFFGKKYSKLFVNSDGNLTFEDPDALVAARSAGRMINGPPRIAALFEDLDPGVAGSVRVLAEEGRVVVSWRGVPVFATAGVGPLNTFQARLYPDGRIELAYAGVQATSVINGISPGRLAPGYAFVSFARPVAGREYSGAVLERFQTAEAIDMVLLSESFYRTHDDAYDYVVVYNDLGVPASSTAVAFALTVRNEGTGFGRTVADFSASYASKGRLQTLINMGPLQQYTTDPYGITLTRPDMTPVGVMAHEAGHRFLSFVSVPNANGTGTPMLHAVFGGHWSFNFNAEASLMEGTRIVDNGPGVSPRFRTTAILQGFSQFDQYLMGLRPAEDVPPMFFVSGATGLPGFPQTGFGFNGDRRDVEVSEIAQIYGRRSPDHTVAQRRFRFAFILVTGPAGPLPGSLEKLNAYRREFELYFSRLTEGRAIAETTLARHLAFSAWPAAGVVRGETTRATLSIEAPRATPLNIRLNAPGSLLAFPGEVTIPTGERSVSFPVEGRIVGVEEITARAADGAFNQAVAKVQVNAARANLRLRVVSGANQRVRVGQTLPNPIVVELVDQNSLPYANVPVLARVRDGDVLLDSEQATDARGRVQFRWTPGIAERRDMLIQVDGVPDLWVSVTAMP